MLHCGLHAVNARLVGMVRCQWRAIKNTVWQHTGQSEPFGHQVSDYISLLLMNMERFFCFVPSACITKSDIVVWARQPRKERQRQTVYKERNKVSSCSIAPVYLQQHSDSL